MANTVSLCKCHGNVMRGHLSIAVNTFSMDNSIERFKSFSRKKHGWSKTAYMCWYMKDDVELGFVEPCAGPLCSNEKKNFNFGFQGILKHEIISTSNPF